MTPLSERLRAKLALPELVTLEYRPLELKTKSPHEAYEDGFYKGLDQEHTRTAPVVDALVECVSAIEYYAQGYTSFERSADAAFPPGARARQALAKLEAAIEGRE